MTGEAPKSTHRTKKQETEEITFKCRRCGAQKPISEMRIIVRFRPVMVVCQDCEKQIR